MTDRKKPQRRAPEQVVGPENLPFSVMKWRGELPHLYKEGCSYFVTFCLFDVSARNRDRFPDREEAGGIARAYDLDASLGECFLRNPEVAEVVEGALLHFQGERYDLTAWCVMPNHVHAVVTPAAEHRLTSVLHSWKSYSAHRANQILGRTGEFWERESFDHLIRNERAFDKFVAYTENNPVAAGLCGTPEEWPYGSARLRDEDG
jgi:REP element-mobilizing transposase RayT